MCILYYRENRIKEILNKSPFFGYYFSRSVHMNEKSNLFIITSNQTFRKLFPIVECLPQKAQNGFFDIMRLIKSRHYYGKPIYLHFPVL